MPLCHYCNSREAGSREHLPGVAALNDSPVSIRYLVPTGGETRVVERIETEGFVVRTICTKCNQRTGGSYGGAFKDFAFQFRSSGVFDDESAQRAWISLKEIQPLRVLKQLAAMFLAAQVELEPARWEAIQRFVRARDAKLPADSLRFYLYRNASTLGRVTSLAGMGFLFQRPPWEPLLASEISWPPLGVVYATEAHPHMEGMKDITDWGQYSFKARASFGFSVPRLRVETNWPLGYGTPREVDDWMTAKGVIILVTNSGETASPAQIAALVRRRPRRPHA